MKLTAEQEDIINSGDNIIINAVAGSGKTTTIIEYAKTRPENSRILYLAFNKSVKLEAVNKFTQKKIKNITIETAHSLAYKNIVFRHGYKVRTLGYKTHEIAGLLGLQGNGEKHHEFVIANHINKFIACFCNSNKPKVQDVNYLETISDAKAKTFVKTFYPFIEAQTRKLLAKMDKGEIEITHDFYLKKFQLQKPVLSFDYILFDEGQDASPAMLDIFLQQPAVKVIVGDTHQQIYSWRYAVNSLEKTGFQKFNLSHSFRFGSNIAQLATTILFWKDYITPFTPVAIKGMGSTNTGTVTKAVIGRTNLGLLLKAIEYVTEKKNINHIYFEGNINSYTYADEGASLYDVLNLQNNKRSAIKDELIKSMASIKDLEEYIEKTEDAQLGMMVEIVKKYGNDIYDIIKSIKQKHIDSDKKEEAEVIFSTVHRCKGMEYDSVHLVNDFITEEKVERQAMDLDNDEKKISKLNEEINLLYVAVTRTKNTLYIPEELLPTDFPKLAQINIIKKEEKKEPVITQPVKTKSSFSKYTGSNGKTFSVELLRTKHGEAYKPWTPEQDEKLIQLFNNNTSDTEIIKQFGRNAGAIRARLRKLGLK
jgi:F-box protein, helicase, 18